MKDQEWIERGAGRHYLEVRPTLGRHLAPATHFAMHLCIILVRDVEPHFM
jgi:hypothetical protein